MTILETNKSYRITTPAKLNLFLELHGRRSDGFHELETLMTAVSICDTVELTPVLEGQIRLTCRWGEGIESGRKASHLHGDREMDAQPQLDHEVPRGPDNIVVRALELFRRTAGVEYGARVQLVKRIPAAAGLGGASSDAAAAIALANRAWGLNWPVQQLAELGAKLGSDIPFFFYGGMAVCRGRGEQIEPVSAIGPLHFVVVKPPTGLATADVYRNCHVPSEPYPIQPIVDAIQIGNRARIGKRLFNRLAEPAGRLSQWVRRLSRQFSTLDCLGHQLSGSGSSYFGVFRSRRHAQRMSNKLGSLSLGQVFCARSLGCLHYVRP